MNILEIAAIGPDYRPLSLHTRLEWLQLDFITGRIGLPELEARTEKLMRRGIDEDRVLYPISDEHRFVRELA